MKRKLVMLVLGVMLSVSSFSVSKDMEDLIIMKQEALLETMDKLLEVTKDNDKIVYLETKMRKEKFKKFFSEYDFKTMTDKRAEEISSTLSDMESAHYEVYTIYKK